MQVTAGGCVSSMGVVVVDVQALAGWGGRAGEALQRMAPAALVRAGLPPRRLRSVLIESLPLTDAARAALTLAGAGGAPVDLRLAPGLFLRRSIALPVAARRDAAGAVALQMRQSMPGQAEGLIWRHAGGTGGTVDVYILKEARLAEVVAAAGSGLRRVVIDGVEADPLHDARGRTDAPERFWNRSAPMVAAGLLVGVLAVQFWSLTAVRQAVAEAGSTVAALRDEAAAARAEAEARSAETAARLGDVARLSREGQRLALVADLTRVLGDGVWISSLALDGGVLRLAGFAEGDVAQVVAAIRPLDWVQTVDLDGAVGMDGGTGERRFQLIVTLKDGGDA